MDQFNKTQHTQGHANTLVNKQDIETNPFVFLLKKTEKLASAVYLMTNHFSDAEPLKRSLRDKSSHLVSFMVGYKDLNGVQLHSFNKEIESRVIEIVSLLEISLNAGLISRMNFGLVQEEFIKLINTIKSVPNTVTDNSEVRVINEGYFNVGDYRSDHRKEHDILHGHKSHITNILDSKSDKRDHSLQNQNKEFKKTDRQNTILSLIGRKGEISVKDVSEVIRNCSEKTIQRELLSLVALGVIKKVGERRWSKYSLV